MNKIMRVLHTEEDKIFLDYFTEEEREKIIKDFFIIGNLAIPEKVNAKKSLKELSEEDHTLFFEELGYTVLNFEEFKEKTAHTLTETIIIPERDNDDDEWKN